MLFTIKKSLDKFLRYDWSKLGHIIGFLQEEKTKTAKKIFHLKSISPTFFKQSSLNFHCLVFVLKKQYVG